MRGDRIDDFIRMPVLELVLSRDSRQSMPVSGLTVRAIALRMCSARGWIPEPSGFISWIVARVASSSGSQKLHDEPTLAKRFPCVKASVVVT